MRNKGKAGCGCLIAVLVICMICIGFFVHPITLKMIGRQFRYDDKIIKADAIFVPRFIEDRNGELYFEAFREYWAGNGKVIFVENDRIFGVSIVELIKKTAKSRGIKDAVIKGLEVGGEGLRATKIKEKFTAMGCKKIIVVVPEYASRRFHLLYGTSQPDSKVLFLVRPSPVSFFKADSWWKDSISRVILIKETYNIGLFYLACFKYGESAK